MIVLLPKGGGEFCGIGLVKLIRKALSGVLNCLIGAVVDFHGMLHRFRAGRGTGAASLSSSLLQKRTAMREEFLYDIFLDHINPAAPGTGSYACISW